VNQRKDTARRSRNPIVLVLVVILVIESRGIEDEDDDENENDILRSLRANRGIALQRCKDARISAAETNPQGWQRVVVPPLPRTTTGKRTSVGRTPGEGVPEPRRPDRSNHLTTAQPFTPGHLAHRVWHPSRGAGLLLCRCPEVAAQKPAATSGYPLTTLRVDRSRTSKLQSLNPPALLQPCRENRRLQ